LFFFAPWRLRVMPADSPIRSKGAGGGQKYRLACVLETGFPVAGGGSEKPAPLTRLVYRPQKFQMFPFCRRIFNDFWS
jgi:hypothetical protein